MKQGLSHRSTCNRRPKAGSTPCVLIVPYGVRAQNTRESPLTCPTSNTLEIQSTIRVLHSLLVPVTFRVLVQLTLRILVTPGRPVSLITPVILGMPYTSSLILCPTGIQVPCMAGSRSSNIIEFFHSSRYLYSSKTVPGMEKGLFLTPSDYRKHGVSIIRGTRRLRVLLYMQGIWDRFVCTFKQCISL